ncbi:MAG: indole-3-glycerol-phosphate synthase [Bacteroides sp.]|nr:indole-3-glycerol-phosphate synthase [Bacteroides sp.]
MEANILQRIIDAKRISLEHSRKDISDAAMATRADEASERRKVISMSDALRAKSPAAVIAEFKRRSPSKGWISPDGDPASVVGTYYAEGAAAASVLTEEDFFGGSAADLIAARAAAPAMPIIRKDFIIEPYQIDEARVIGADAILLIASALTPGDAAAIAAHARSRGLEVLLELHTPEEIEYVNGVAPDMVGVNNRRLADFITSISVAEQMASLLPQEAVKVAESGVAGPDDVACLQRAGFDAFLVGEYLMRGHSINSLFSK